MHLISQNCPQKVSTSMVFCKKVGEGFGERFKVALWLPCEASSLREEKKLFDILNHGNTEEVEKVNHEIIRNEKAMLPNSPELYTEKKAYRK